MASREAGTSHLARNLPCQDRFACAGLEDGGVVAIVADGAGSASLGERGAEIVVDCVTRLVLTELERPAFDLEATLRQAALVARDAVLDAARGLEIQPRELACTLLAVVCEPQGGAALQLGDGVIIVGEDGPRWSWAFWPQRGEYANTTTFLTDSDAEEKWEVAALPATVSHLAVMSDGLEPLALCYADQSVFSPFLDGMIAPLVKAPEKGEVAQLSEALSTFLRSRRVTARTDDDVTLVLATCAPVT